MHGTENTVKQIVMAGKIVGKERGFITPADTPRERQPAFGLRACTSGRPCGTFLRSGNFEGTKLELF